MPLTHSAGKMYAEYASAEPGTAGGARLVPAPAGTLGILLGAAANPQIGTWHWALSGKGDVD